MSELKVNKISPRSGTAITLGDSGDTFTIPSGATLAIAGSVTGFTSAGIDDNATSVAITIDSNENVGIGTTSPDTLLSLEKNNAPIIQFKDTSGATDEKIWRVNGLNDAYRIQTWNDALNSNQVAYQVMRSGVDVSNHRFYTEDSERMRLTTTGLGVGTSAPDQKIHAESSQNTLIKSKTTTSTALGGFEAHSSGGTSYIKIHQLGPSFGGTTFGGVTGNDQALIEAQAASSLAFSTQGGTPDIIFAPGRTAKLTLKNGGQLGLGAVPPSGSSSSSYKQFFVSTGGSLVDSGGSGPATQLLNNSYIGSGNNNFATVTAKASRINLTSGRIDFANAGSHSADAQQSFTERVRIHDNGVVAFNNGIVLGDGVNNTASNTIDDYEEGTWTPTFDTGELNGFSGSGTANDSVYTKIGNLCHIFTRIQFASSSGTLAVGDKFVIQPSSLPFTRIQTDGQGTGSAVFHYNANGNGLASVTASGSDLRIFVHNVIGSPTRTSTAYIAFTYQTT